MQRESLYAREEREIAWPMEGRLEGVFGWPREEGVVLPFALVRWAWETGGIKVYHEKSALRE